MNRTALAALEKLRTGVQQERDGEFPNDPDFYDWAEKLITETEEAIKSAERPST